MFLRAETLQAKTKEKLLLESHPTARLAEKSAAENYVTRHEWGVSSDSTLQKHRPLTDQPFSKFLLRMVSVPVSDSAAFASVKPLLHERRVDFLEFSSTRLMLWSYTRWVAVGACLLYTSPSPRDS